VRDYLRTLRPRYAAATRAAKQQILTEFCATTGYHRKAAIRALRAPTRRRSARRGRPRTYDPQAQTGLSAIWEAAGYPWSVRLKALLPLWLPWAARRFAFAPATVQQLRTMSPSTMDRALRPHKRALQRRLYGRTKPGTLLKHHIPVKTDRWDTTTPGFTEVDLVAHSGPWADGEFAQSLNLTDIHTGWVETRAVRTKSHQAVAHALDEIATALPFPLRGIDSDNGGEFINNRLFQYCRHRHIQFTRGRAYKKDDNAHIEQKNWTHVRKLVGWARFDSPAAVDALNDLYRHELRLMMNLFQPSVKLVRTVRVGARLRRVYDAPTTPLDRLAASNGVDPQRLVEPQQQRARLDPFALAETIQRKLARIQALAIPTPRTLSPEDRHALSVLTARRPAPTHPWRRPVTPLMTR